MKHLAAVLLGFASLASAQQPATEIEAGVSRDRLSGGRADWHSYELEIARHLGQRQTFYVTARENERFNLRDTQLGAGYVHPFSPSLTGQIEGQYSSEHRVLAHRSFFGGLSWAGGDGWVLSGGLRRNNYTASDTTLASLGAERYFSSLRAGYTLYLGRPDGAPTGSSHRFVLSHYYGERSSIGVSFITGREVENVGPPVGVSGTRVRELALGGRHWFTPSWAVSADLWTREQGSLYDRRGLRVGIRSRF